MHMPENNSKDFAPPPQGQHLARCYRVVDLGTQHNTKWNKMQRKIMISWELYCDERTEEGGLFTTHQRYTFSSAPKANFRNDLESWRGRPFQESEFGPDGFNIRKLIGVPCLIQIVHNENDGKVYGNMDSIMAVPKTMKDTVPGAENETVFVGLQPEDFEPAEYEKLSDTLKGTIMSSPEWAELNGTTTEQVHDRPDTTPENPDMDDEIPF